MTARNFRRLACNWVKRSLSRLVPGICRRFWALGCRGVLLLAGSILAYNVLTVSLTYPLIGTGLLARAAWRRIHRQWQASTAYGTARVATFDDLWRANLTGRHGLVLGRLGYIGRPTRGAAVRALCSPRVDSATACQMALSAFLGQRRNDQFLRINDFVHLLTCAPAGGGKTVSVLGPNLLSYEGNVIVLDKGGELYKLTAKHREQHFGHQIVRLDPGLLLGEGADRWNPLDRIDPQSKSFISTCRDIANMIVVATGEERDPHFVESAENVITAGIAYVMACEGDPAARNLKGVRTQLASRANYEAARNRMQQIEQFGGVLLDAGQSLGWHVDRELGSVMSTVQRCTHIFADPLVDEATWESNFTPKKLRSGRMSIFIIVPPDRTIVWAPLWRLYLGNLLRVVTEGVPSETNPVLFMVDEVAHIGGRLRALEDAITLLRGSGARVWLFVQSLDQLNKCFGERSSTVLDNLNTQQYFSITSYDTAEALSKRIGDQTIAVTSGGSTSGKSWSSGGAGKNSSGITSNNGSNTNTSEIARRLYKPEEILTFPSSKGLVFHKNHPVIETELIKYYRDKAFRRRRWRGYGTGRSRGVGLSGMLLALFALAWSGVLTLCVAQLPVWVPQIQRALAPRLRGVTHPAWPAGGGLPYSGPGYDPNPYLQGNQWQSGQSLPYYREPQYYP